MTENEKILDERKSVYGEFEHQAECVGSIICNLIECSVLNGKEPTNKQVGAFAYIAVKLARYAVSPSHYDTMLDLENYCKLIKDMEVENAKQNV